MTRPPLHLFLLPAYPVLFLYARNQDHIPLGQLWAPLAVVAFLALAAGLLGGRWSREPEAAAAWVSLTVLWTFAYGALARASGAGRPSANGAVLPLSAVWILWGLAPLALVLALARWRHRVPALRRVLDGAGVALVLFAVVPIGLRQADLHRFRAPVAAPPTVGRSTDGPRPNIYYVILDSYGREDLLRDLYGYDNAPMTAFLRSRGFFVGDASRSNYGQTTVSLASSLNMDYLQNLLGPEVADRSSREYALELMRHSAVFRRLRDRGYAIITVQSQYAVADIDNQDLHLRYSAFRSEFTEGLLAQTPLDPVLSLARAGLSSVEYHRRAILYAFDRIPAISPRRAPYMVYAHLVTPHPQFVFDARGDNPLPGEGFSIVDGNALGMDPGRYRRLYAGQLEYVNGLLRSMVDRILAGDDGSVVILQADHGPGSGWSRERMDRTDLRERFSILYAVRLPRGGPGPFYPSITPVNTFRAVFSACFGDDLPFLEDRSYFSPMARPYRFTEVTGSW